MITTRTVHAQRRTYTTSTSGTVAGHVAAYRAALALARQSHPGWEHHAGRVCYLVSDAGQIVRTCKDDSGIRVTADRVVGRVSA